MSPLLMLTLVLGLLAAAVWLTRPRWQRAVASVMPGVHVQRPMLLAVAVALFLVAGPVLCYLWLGAPDDASAGRAMKTAPPPVKTPQAEREPRAAAPMLEPRNDGIARAEGRVSLMIDYLAARLKSHPDDAEGWQTLGRSYAALGRHAQAAAALENATRLRPDDATLLAEQAFSAAVTDQDAAHGDAARLIARALEIDPNHSKALALAGTLALDRKDYHAAARYWEQLARSEPAGSPIAKQLQASILQVRQLAVTQATLAPVAAPASGLGAVRGQVSGTVRLAPALLARAAPDDAVFVFARAPSGPRVPLAVLRKQVKDLPLRFTLDDSLSAPAGTLLSSAASVVVGARIARSGSAFASDGDLQGQLGAVPLGRGNVQIEINEVVRMR